MSEACPNQDARKLADAARCGRNCDKFLVGLVFCSLVRASEALASEQGSIPIRAVMPDFDALRPATTLSVPTLPLPAAFQAPKLPETPAFSNKDFRPRGRSIFEPDTARDTGDEAPMLRGTTVWQRMKDYRSRDRVRLITLWESGASTVSLQAGRKGDPSLQWTSRWMNRGGSTRGLLDQLFSISFAGAGNRLRNASRGSSSGGTGSRPAAMPISRSELGSSK
jgi:hypothetical protein